MMLDAYTLTPGGQRDTFTTHRDVMAAIIAAARTRAGIG